jgi:2-polyprenyl-6-hydroxyphenyl methylase / 3-demethylubiquinone-9 3-methyltransferase
MLRKDVLRSAPQAAVDRSTADPAEIARFDALAEEWWKPRGAFKVVHAFNAARVAYLTEQLPRWCGRSAGLPQPLSGLTMLDVGCGAGIVSEPLSRLGGDLRGIDAAERNVMVAQRHAATTKAPVTYQHALPEDLAGQQFDIVLSLEVVEHVANVPAFLNAVGQLVKPGGVLVIGTLNRTATSFAKAIVGAEYIMRWLPRGTHDWRKFVTPDELHTHLSPQGFTPLERVGVDLNPLTMQWRITAASRSTYLQAFKRA